MINVIDKLPVEKVKSIQEVMIDACLAYELGGDWRKIFLIAKNGALGGQKKAFEILCAADHAAMDRLERTLLNS